MNDTKVPRQVWRSAWKVIAFLFGMLIFHGKIAVLLAFVAFGAAMSLVPAVFNAVSSVVELVSGTGSIRANHQRQLAGLQSGLDEEKLANRRLRQELAQTQAELANRKVLYRGASRPIGEAVKDTSQRVADRAKVAAGRNIAAMGGEALPIVGIAVIAAATAWELKDTCDLLNDMRELDAAFNDNPISPDEVCGMHVPSGTEVWDSVTASPGKVWEASKDRFSDIKEIELPIWIKTVLSWGGGLFDE